VLERLDERERLGSTGFGRGVAIPHARVQGLKRPVAALLRLQEPVDFAAADGMPVDLVFGLLSPENAGVSHLHALAAISRIVRDERMHEAFSDAKDEETLFALLTNVTDRDAA
jgi:PTS system nitrogen regulatory IIA component